jgi:hypothetical protein
MKIVDRVTVLQNISDTKTVQNFGTFLGTNPHKLGTVATMYPELAITTLTDALKNVFYNPTKKEGSFTPINSMVVEWKIDVNFIKRVQIVGSISGNGANQKVETIIMEEQYYDKNDTFTLENHQQLFIVAAPKKLATKRWEYRVKLVANDYGKTINTTYAAAGRFTRYRSNYHPELSERGYTKFVANSEVHRNYLSRHRASTSWSSDFAQQEEVYIQTGKDPKTTASYYKMVKKEKECLDNFLLSRENNCIFGQSNFDINGKCLLQEDDGRDIPMGDGVIAQIERYCDKFFYSVLNSETFISVLAAMRDKSGQSQGNTYAVVCNERLWDDVGRTMATDLRFISAADGAWFWSKQKNDKVNLGNTFDTYRFQGNTITFMPNRALSQEFPDYGYGIFLDTGADLTTGRPNVAMFTVEGAEMLQGNLVGMGGMDGKTSGNISTSVAGSQWHLLGTSGAMVFNPYKSFVLQENVVG